MKTTYDFGDKNSLKEANDFLQELEYAQVNKKYKLIFNTPNIYNKKKLSAHFLIKFENDFYLKALKTHGVYDFEFISSHFENAEVTFYESREYSLNIFHILCDMYDDVFFDVNNYYPVNFELTETYKKYYEYFDDNKGTRYYGVKPTKIIEFIINHYDLIKLELLKNKG